MINDLKEIIAVNSVLGEKKAGAPFGAGPRAALDWFLAKSASYGLKTGEDEGYAGWAEYGEGKLVAVLAHLDIVPAGQGWATDPFTLTNENGNLYGRGTIDDKGALVAALHALKAIKDSGINPGGRIRIIAGCNEESGCECMKHYIAHQELPEAAFTPDAEFPVISSEKGISHIRLRFAREEELRSSFSYIRSGERANIVPANAECKIVGEAAARLTESPASAVFTRESIAERLAEDGVELADLSINSDGGLIIGARGVAAHGSTPEKGDNAARKLFSFLAAAFGSPALHFIADYLAPKDAAERLGIAAADEQSGVLTINLGIISFEGRELTATIDVRRPLCMSHDELCRRIKAKLPEDCKFETLTNEPNLYVEPGSKLISALLGVYEKHFNEQGRPLRIGGGTYAKTLKNCVAFGPSLEHVDYHMHDADEFIPVELFYKLVDVYKDAMLALCSIV